MLVARRLYLYFVAGVSLAVLAAGLVNLLELGLEIGRASCRERV